MQLAPETELACTPCRCHDFVPGYWVAPEPTEVSAEDRSLMLDMDWSNLRDLICAVLVSVFRNEKRVALEAVRRGTTVDQLTAAAITEAVRRHTQGHLASPGIDWASLGDRVYALLVKIRQHKKQFAQKARRRNLTPEQQTAALIVEMVRKQLQERQLPPRTPLDRYREGPTDQELDCR
jgi:hypothetical protein